MSQQQQTTAPAASNGGLTAPPPPSTTPDQLSASRAVRPREEDPKPADSQDVVDEEDVNEDEETDDEDGQGSSLLSPVIKREGAGKFSLNSLKDMQQEVVNWLRENFEVDEEISLARDSIFAYYNEFAKTRLLERMGTASFGKIVRLVFTEVKTRRLGVRGQSKYHYQGIRIKATSPLAGKEIQQRTTGPLPKRSFSSFFLSFSSALSHPFSHPFSYLFPSFFLSFISFSLSRPSG